MKGGEENMFKGTTAEAIMLCHSCKKEYMVYWTGIRRKNPQGCPQCGAEIDEVMWGMVVDAIGDRKSVV